MEILGRRCDMLPQRFRDKLESLMVEARLEGLDFKWVFGQLFRMGFDIACDLRLNDLKNYYPFLWKNLESEEFELPFFIDDPKWKVPVDAVLYDRASGNWYFNVIFEYRIYKLRLNFPRKESEFMRVCEDFYKLAMECSRVGSWVLRG
jgi:hypothetical protein